MDYEHNVFRIFDAAGFSKPADAAEIPVIVKNHRFF
jgi:hypothetical protein